MSGTATSTVDWILETHAHADHLSAAQHLKRQVGGRIGIGARITEVQRIFKEVFNLERTFNTDGTQFDHLFEDGETFLIGRQEARVMYTPGHTPGLRHLRHRRGGLRRRHAVHARWRHGPRRFPGGDATTLYRSIHRILSLPPETRLFICHDYQPGGREPRWETTVADERERNIHIGHDRTEDEFVAMRTARDRTLNTPTLLVPSIQINIRAGEMPPPEDNGTAYIKVPLNRL